MVLKGTGEIGRRGKAEFGRNLLDRGFGFAQQAAGLKDHPITEQGRGGAPACLIANPCQMRWRYTQCLGVLGHVHAALILGLDHFGESCGQALGGIGCFVVIAMQQNLAFQPNGQQSGVVVCGANAFWSRAFQLALQIVQNAGDFALRAGIADTQMHWHMGQWKPQVARNKYGSSENLHRHLEPVHYA